MRRLLYFIHTSLQCKTTLLRRQVFSELFSLIFSMTLLHYKFHTTLNHIDTVLLKNSVRRRFSASARRSSLNVG